MIYYAKWFSRKPFRAILRAFRYNRDQMPETTKPPAPSPPSQPRTREPANDRVCCDRCGAEMFRMHAVWRCPACGYKTDCCGW